MEHETARSDVYRFAGFTLDPDAGVLRDGSSERVLRPKTFELLTYFVRNAGRTVSKNELLDAVWSGVIVTEDSLTQAVHDLRRVLGDAGQNLIRTVPRRGYRFAKDALETNVVQISEQPYSTRPQTPSIAVMPFVNLGSDPEHEFFADGLTEDLITALSRIRDLLVISRSSSFVYKGRAFRLAEVASELKVRYLLEGSVRVSGNRVRVTAQLTEGVSGSNAWAERYDGDLTDIFELQDEITRNIALSMQIQLTYGEFARLWEGQTKDLRAWEKMALGRDLFLRFDAASNRSAQAAFKEALAVDPNYTGAMIQLGLTHWWDARFNENVDRAQALQQAQEQAERALAINPDLGGAYMLAGGVKFLRLQHAEAVALCEKAVDLAPNDSWAHAFLGLVYIYAGKAHQGAGALQTAMRLSPHYPAWYRYQYSKAHLWTGRLDLAEEGAKEDLLLEPDDPYGYALLATVYGFQGRGLDAARMVSILREKFPCFSLKNMALSEPYSDPDQLARVINTLKQAGLPG